MADVYVNALTQISTEPITTDSLVAVNRNTNEGKIIDYNLLADAILNKITSKQFSGLNTTSKLLVGAINELDSDVSSLNSGLTTLSNNLKGFRLYPQYPNIHSSNIDSITSNGIYETWFQRGLPYNEVWGILIVIGTSTVIEQIQITRKGIACRHYETNAWGTWTKVALS